MIGKNCDGNFIALEPAVGHETRSRKGQKDLKQKGRRQRTRVGLVSLQGGLNSGALLLEGGSLLDGARDALSLLRASRLELLQRLPTKARLEIATF